MPPVPKDVPKNNVREIAALQMLRAKYADYQFEETFSWVDQGMVTSVKNQGQCGSCTAFAITGAVESCFAIVRSLCMYLRRVGIIECFAGNIIGGQIFHYLFPW